MLHPEEPTKENFQVLNNNKDSLLFSKQKRIVFLDFYKRFAKHLHLFAFKNWFQINMLIC